MLLRGESEREPLAAKRMLKLASALAGGLAAAGVAHAQTQMADAPPVFSPVDQNGVDLATGQFNFSMTDLSIGDPGAGGLVYARSFFGPGWRDNYVGTINVGTGADANKYTVSLGGSSETFTLSGGVYTSDQGSGSTLSLASNIYTYTSANGAVALFNRTLADGMVFEANEGASHRSRRPTASSSRFTTMRSRFRAQPGVGCNR